MSARRVTALPAALLLAAARPAGLRADFEPGWREARTYQAAGRRAESLEQIIAGLD